MDVLASTLTAVALATAPLSVPATGPAPAPAVQASTAAAAAPAASTATASVPSVSTAAAAPAAVAAATVTVQINYPGEKASFPALSATFLLGNVQPPDSKLSVNGKSVSVHPKGGFIAYVPVQSGDFVFKAEASSGTAKAVLERRVKFDAPLLPPTTTELVIDPRTVLPAGDVELRPGDWLKVAARSMAGLSGTYRIYGVKRSLPMVETQPGLYEGAYQIRHEDRASSETVRIYLSGKPGDVEYDAPGRLTILDEGLVPAVVNRDTYELNNVRAAPGRGYSLFLPNGTKALISGRQGDEVRLRFSGTETGWLSSAHVKALPAGTPPPRAALGAIELLKGERSSKLRLSLSDRVPFKIDLEPGRARLTLYYTDAHTNWITFDTKDPFIRDVRWLQAEDGVAVVDVWLANRDAVPWGSHAAFTNGNLDWELRWPPAPTSGNPLAGVTVALDPGHSPSDPGRIGPLGATERAHNLRQAKALETLLKKEGASVVMTRTTDEAEVNLQERVDQAWKARADALISLHNNAVPDGVDPTASPRGFAVFYFHPQSRGLAEAIHKQYQRNLPLSDEGLRFGDLFMARTPRMPAVLLETAYFILPDQEVLLMDEAFNDKVAQSLLQALKDFFAKARKN